MFICLFIFFSCLGLSSGGDFYFLFFFSEQPGWRGIFGFWGRIYFDLIIFGYLFFFLFRCGCSIFDLTLYSPTTLPTTDNTILTTSTTSARSPVQPSIA